MHDGLAVGRGLKFTAGELEKLACWDLERKFLINRKAGVDSPG